VSDSDLDEEDEEGGIDETAKDSRWILLWRGTTLWRYLKMRNAWMFLWNECLQQRRSSTWIFQPRERNVLSRVAEYW
jgi:hypothetical protein